MRSRKVVIGTLAGAVFATLVGVVVFAYSQEAQAGRCLCPKLLAPVVCDNGKTYANPCLAECHNADNCVPTGGGL